jgi:hypothetical protein
MEAFKYLQYQHREIVKLKRCYRITQNININLLTVTINRERDVDSEHGTSYITSAIGSRLSHGVPYLAVLV